MRHHSYYSEEDDIKAKVYDSVLFRRLLKYAKPYTLLIVVSIIFLFIITALTLSQPYLTKIAIDKHITASSKKIDFTGFEQLEIELLQENKEIFSPIDDKVYLVDVSLMKEIDLEKLNILEDGGAIGKVRYLVFAKENYSDDEWQKIKSICNGYDEIMPTKGGFYVSYNDLSSIEKADLHTLREQNYKGLIVIVIIYTSILVATFLFNYAQIYMMTYAGQKIMYDIRADVVKHLQNLSLSFFDKNPVGRLVTRPTNDVKALNQMYTDVLITLFKDVFTLVGIMVIMLRMHWRLALVSFIVIPLMFYLTKRFRARARAAYREVRKKVAVINATLNENITGIRIIKIFNQEDDVYKKFKAIDHDNFLAQFNQMKVMATFGPSLEMLMSVATALVLWYGGLQVMSNTVTLGILVAFISYVQMLFRPIRELSEKYNIMQGAMAASERIFELIDTEEGIKNPNESMEINSVKGHIEFKDVWFAYNKDEWILKDITFDVKPGESVALVGATGAGKTSIINLLSRFYDIQKGCISIDGVSIKDVDKYDLRSRIGVVLQDPFLFSRNISDNIRLNTEWITDDEVQTSAKYVNANYFIEKLPHKYQEPVMERGVTLSTGQKQLLAFARVLAHNPHILVLDEATSNIDTETEQLIQEAMWKLMTGRTSIIIAHRLSTIKNVDKIIVMHKGRIREVGNHQELLAKKGIYHNLYKLQYQAQEN